MIIKVNTDRGTLSIDKGPGESIDPTSYPDLVADAVRAAYAGNLIEDDVTFDIAVVF